MGRIKKKKKVGKIEKFPLLLFSTLKELTWKNVQESNPSPCHTTTVDVPFSKRGGSWRTWEMQTESRAIFPRLSGLNISPSDSLILVKLVVIDDDTVSA